MFRTGLVSISFRQYTPLEIIQAAAAANLQEIEWGGDVHLPPGDPATAHEVAMLTADGGLKTAAYGSYYRLCSSPADEFKRILEAAEILGAPVIRIWGGTKGSALVDDRAFDALVADGRRIADMAQKSGRVLSLECHCDTITDNYCAALRFLQAVDSPAMTMYWQPNQFKSAAYNLEAAAALRPYVTNLHVFHWDAQRRYPLRDGADIWEQYLRIFSGDQSDHSLLLEFMHDDRLETLHQTADTLRSWLLQSQRTTERRKKV